MPYSRSINAALLIAGAALVAGCRDEVQPVAPGAAPSLSTAPSSGTVTFTVYPNQELEQPIGEHKIKFTPNAICDPASSTYGLGEWDKPCTPITRPVQIIATYKVLEDGRPRVDFEPALRFNPAERVTLWLRDRRMPKERTDVEILWADAHGALVDEDETDPTLATHTARKGYATRRIKHFSGYLISAGRSYDGDGYTETSTTTY